jgi:membrane dipeptidase
MKEHMRSFLSLPLVLLLALSLAAGLPLLPPPQQKDAAGPAVSAEARRIHQAAILVDTHADTTQFFMDDAFDLADPPYDWLHFDLETAEAGNVGGEFFAVWVDPALPRDQYAHTAYRLIDSVYQQVERNPGRMVMACTADDIVAARRGPHKRLAALMGVEGGHAIENDLRHLRNFYRLGVRYMTLTHSNNNEWADSSGATPVHGGLTDRGRDVVREMNRLGMLVDISHVSDQTFNDVIAATRAPLIASHSSARALTASPRNMTDDMLRAVAKNGGVVMVVFYSGFVDEDFRQAFAAQAPQRTAALAKLREQVKNLPYAERYRRMDQFGRQWAAKLPRPPFRAIIDHIEHVIKVAGIDHVGLGSDFDGIPALPAGIDSAADLPRITQALLDRGYNEEQIHKILGGNFLRVMREAERVARQMQEEGVPSPPSAVE